ncbi:MAG: phosphotransferase [Planctomycetota bacterium]
MSLAAAIEAALPGARILEHAPLAGGISAETTRVRIAHAGGERWVVVRKLGALTLAEDPQAWERELRVREAAAAAGVPTPRPLGGGALPWPHLVLEYAAGEVDATPGLTTKVEAIAQALAQIHALDLAPFADALPAIEPAVHERLQTPPATPDALTREAEVHAALARHWPPPSAERCVLHGDPWPGNLLWAEGALVAVLDWEDACSGPPAADLAIARLELASFASPAAAEGLAAAYRRVSGRALPDLAVWDLYAALRPAGHLPRWAEALPGVGRPDLTLERMVEAHGAFVDQALAALAG